MSSPKFKRLYLWLSIISAAFLLSVIAMMIFCQDDWTETVIGDLLYPLWNLVTVAALFYAAKRTSSRSRKEGRAWWVLAIAQLAYLIGDILWSVYEIVLLQTPYPSIADWFAIAQYPLFIIAILHLPVRQNKFRARLKNLLDGGIIMAVALLVFWNYLLGPLMAAGANDSFYLQAVSLAYPVGDLLMLWALLLLIYRKLEVENPGPLVLLAAGVLITIVADTNYSLQSLLGTYGAGGWLDIGWGVANSIFAFAAIWQASLPAASKVIDDSATTGQTSEINAISWATYLPYLWLAGAFVMLVQSHYSDSIISYDKMAISVGLIVGMVLFRQIITLLENGQLFNQLEKALQQVHLQTTELKKSNQDLQIEVEERKRAEQQLAYDALHDALTGLPNRVLFLDRLEHSLEFMKRRKNYNFAVLFLDLDQFKIINDSLGHSVGDQLLVGIAHKLRACLRTSDTVARLGGDEFVILLEDVLDENAVITTAKRIQDRLNTPFSLGGQDVFVTASTGIVLNVQEYKLPEDIMRDADLAMYQAKALGKSRFEIFNSHMRERAVGRLELENDLRNALENNELQLYYQPIVALESNKIAGFEALLRWQHPRRGMVNPLEFIHIAEETGMIIPIGEWILKEACLQIKQWQSEYPQIPPLSISVNISGKQIYHPDFTERVGGILKDNGLDGKFLKMEITENVCLTGTDIVSNVFKKLSQLGIQIYIDDFGTGYSSLSYLQNYPINTIKIDRAFIARLDSSDKNRNIVRTIIAMAHDLGMDAIAEGVETFDQYKMIKELGCNYGQGFLLSHPVDKVKAKELLQSLSSNEGYNLSNRPTVPVKHGS